MPLKQIARKLAGRTGVEGEGQLVIEIPALADAEQFSSPRYSDHVPCGFAK